MAEDPSLGGLVPSYLDLRWHFDPVAATSHGLTEHDGRLGDFSAESVRLHVVALKSLAASLEAAAPDSVDDEIDRTALLNDVRVMIHRFTTERPHVTDPAFWLNHVLEGLYHLLALTDRPREHRARAARERLEAIPRFLDLAQETLGECPPVLLEHVGQQLRPEATDGFPEVLGRARASVDAFGRYLSDDLKRSAAGDFAVGEDAFNFRLHYEHALRDTAPELWRYGAHLVEEVERDLVTLGKQIDPSVKWPVLVDRLRADHPQA